MSNGFLETGLTVTIQNQLPFAIINARDPLAVIAQWDISIRTPSNLGVRLTAPKADNIIFMLPQLPTAGRLSFIGADLDCSSTSENPAETLFKFMHIPALPYAEGSATFFLQQSSLNGVMGAFGVLPPGMYQICFAPQGLAQFLATGISIRLQDELSQMIVNGVKPNYGLRVALPQSRKNDVNFEGLSKSGAAKVEKFYSFIRIGQDCSLITDNDISQTSETSGYMGSGIVNPSDFHIPVAQTDRIQGQALGLYHVCHRSSKEDGILFADTGIVVTVQNQLHRLKVNQIPRIRSAIPKSVNNEVDFCTDESCSNLLPGGMNPTSFISFILPNQECEDLLNFNTLQALPGRSGHIPTVQGKLLRAMDSQYASLDGSFFDGGALYVGIYQVCIGSANLFISTGLSLLVHEYLTTLNINGATPGYGLRVAIPKATVSPTMAYGGPELGTRADQVSLIFVELDCDDPIHNPKLADSSSSGHLDSLGLTKKLVGTDGIKDLTPRMYQACFRSNSNEKFKTTGVSATVQAWASGFLNVPGKPPSLRALLLKTTDASLSFIGSRPSSTAPWPPTKASIIASSGSCTANKANPTTIGTANSGHMSVSLAGAGQPDTFIVSIPSTIAESGNIAELLYQFCIYVDGLWFSTGLAVQVEWAGINGVPETSFEFVSSQESNSFAGSSNAVHVLMKTAQILPPGGILRIENLIGSQTGDSPYFQVEGNSVQVKTLEMMCAGNQSCVVTTPSNYVSTGKILMSAEITIEVACTDFDSTCKQCKEGVVDCSEGIVSVLISNEDEVRDITSISSRGPWKDCIKKCSETRTVVSLHDIIDLSTKAGKPVTFSLTTADATSYYACDHEGSPVTLQAKVTLRMLISTLSQHLLEGSFSSTSGRLTVPHVPFEKNQYIHITIILRNPLRLSPPQVPTVKIVAAKSDGIAVREMAASMPKNRPGILIADSGAQFISAAIEMTSQYTGETNRITLRLKSNWVSAIPGEVSVTIAGLVGSNTADATKLALLDPDQIEIKTFECIGAKHCLVDVDAMPSLANVGFYRATLDVDVYCSDFASYPDKYIRAISACSQISGQVACPQLDKRVLNEAEYSRGPWQNCSGCSTSTRTVMKGYEISEILQRYDTFGLNRFSFEMFASPDVGDLKCYGSPTVQAVKALLTVRIEYSQTYARWVQSEGVLIVLVSPVISKCSSPSALSCLPDISFSFEIKNPSFKNTGPVQSQVLASGGGLVFPSVNLPPIFHIVGARNILQVTASSIRESSRVRGDPDRGYGLNTMTLSFTLDRKLPAGTIITVSGLMGTQTESVSCDTVAAPRCGSNDCIFSPSDKACRNGIQLKGYLMGSSVAAAWNKQSGTLRFKVLVSFAQLQYFEFSFDVYNAVAPQASKTVTISGSGGGFSIQPAIVSGTVLTSDLQTVSIEPDQPRILSALLSENNKIEFEPNRLTAAMILNVPLAPGTQIEISKLSNTFMFPSTGPGWYSDVLPNVRTTAISVLTSTNIRAQGQFTSKSMYHMPWLCRDDGWGVELEYFYEDGTSALECQIKRESAAGTLPQDCAKFYKKRWCTVQKQDSVVVFVDKCIKANNPISFYVDISNGVMPLQDVTVPPELTVEGGSLSAATPFQMTNIYPLRRNLCQGLLSCKTSFVQDERYLDSERRFLPPFAVLRKATLSINLACSSFSDPDQFLQRISLCLVPDCKSLYGNDHDWSLANNACCTPLGCRSYVCADKVPIPTGKIKAFATGPWQGCQGNCSQTQIVLELYDMMPIICAGQTMCEKPKSFTLFMSATGAADKFACSGKGATAVYVLADVKLNLELSYKSAAFASEPVRLKDVKITQSTDAMQALSKFIVVVDSMVTLPLDSEVIITGLTGSMTTEGTIFVIVHPLCDISAMVESGIRIPCSVPSDCIFTSWKQDTGELRVKILREIASVGDILQFAFILRNAPKKQDPRIPRLTAKLGGPNGAQIGPKVASTTVLASSTESKIVEGKFFESTKVRKRLNRIIISFRVNFHLFRGSNVTVYGLSKSGTPSTSQLPVIFDGQNVLGSWIQKEGTLQLELPKFYYPSEAISFSFTLQNSRDPKDTSSISLQVPSATPAVDETISTVLTTDGFLSSEILDFSEASLKQEHALMDQMNRLECAFSSVDDVPVGATILLSGLLGSQTESTIDFPIEIIDSTGAAIFSAAEWNGELGVLSFASQLPVLAGEYYRFSFHLRNPRQKGTKRIARLSVNFGTTNLAMREVGAVLDASDKVAFDDARMSESTRMPSAMNSMTMILQLNIDLEPSVYEIRITGMLQPSDASLSIEGPSTQDFQATIPPGSKTLVLVPSRLIFANTSLTFNWILRNPAQPTTARDISAALFNQLSGIEDITPTAVKGFVFSSTRDGIVTSAQIEESSRTQTASNRLRVILKFDFALSYDSRITLSGLTGTPISVTNLQILGDDSDLFRSIGASTSMGAWTQSTGTLVCHMLKRTIIDPGTAVRLEFDLVNPAKTSTNKVSSIMVSEHSSAAKNFDKMVLLALEQVAFLTAFISESSTVSGVLNTITVSFSVNTKLDVGAKVTITGLLEYSGVVTTRNAVFESYSSRALTVILQHVVVVNTTASFNFVLRNPEIVGSGMKTQISASSVDSSHVGFVLPETGIEGAVLSASEPRQFTLTEIQERTRIQGSLNTISVRLQANLPIPSNTQITLTNLRGTQTFTTNCLSVTSAQTRILSCGLWDDVQAQLVLTVGSGGFQPFDDIEFSFTLVNSAIQQHGVIPMVSASNNVRMTAMVPGAIEWHDGVKIWRGDQFPVTVVGTVLTASEPHIWLSGFVQESSGIVGELNSILIEMEGNTALPPGSMVTVAGLTGTSEVDSSKFDIHGENGKDTHPGLWTQITGILAFELKNQIPEGEIFSFIVQLKNPSAPQRGIKPIVSLSRVTTSERWKIAPFVTSLRENAGVCCLSADDLPRFRLATVRESSNVKNALNVLYFTLFTNVAMTTETKITISGLGGAQNTDNAFIILMNSTSLSGRWREDGQLIVVVDPAMYHCDCIDLCVQNSLAFNVQLRNPANERPKSAVVIRAERPGIVIQETAVSGFVLRSQADPAVFASVSESSKVSGQNNNVTIRMIANCDLDICPAKWQPQDIKWIAKDQTLTMSAVGGASPNAATELEKLFDGLSDTVTSIKQDHTTGQLVDIYYDFGQMFRLEAVSITAGILSSSVNQVKLQFADSLTAPENQWETNTAALMRIGKRTIPSTSSRFDFIAQYWRIRMIDNVDKAIFPQSTTLSEVKFFGCPDVQTATISISNISPANGLVKLYNVKTNRGALRSYGAQVGDVVSMKVSRSIRAFEELSFTFTTKNAPAAQLAKQAGVSVKSGIYQIPMTFAHGEMLASDENAVFSTRTISEDNDLQSDFNTLTIILKANIQLDSGDNIRIIFEKEHMANNLGRDRTPPSCIVNGELISNPCVENNPLFVTRGTTPVTTVAWYAETNVPSLGYTDMKPSVILTLQSTVQKLSEIRVTMKVKNPSQMQQEGLVPEVVGSAIMQKKSMVGSIMQAPRAGPSFTLRIIRHSSDMAEGQNIVTVSLQPGPGADLPAGTVISICGLRGTDADANNGAQFPKEKLFLSRFSSGFEFDATYRIIRKNPVGHVSAYTDELLACIEFEMLTGPWVAGSTASVSFNFKNPVIVLQTAPKVSVVASEKITIQLDLCKDMNQQDVSRCKIPSDAFWTQRRAAFVAVAMYQDNSAVKQRSTISLTLTPNVVVAPGTTLTISGLEGLDAGQNAAIDIKGPKQHLMRLDSWDPATGVVKLFAWEALNSPESPAVVLSFVVINPTATQDDKVLTVCSQFAVPIDGLMDVSGGVAALGGSDCSQPLRLGKYQVNEEVKFVIRDVSESSHVENQDSVIKIQLSSNFEMLPGAIVTFTGLTSSQTQDNVELPVLTSYYEGNQQTETALWRQPDGLLKVSLSTKINISPTNFMLSFVLRNPTRAAASASTAKVYLNVANVGASSFEFLPLDGTILRAPDNARFTAVKIEEQTRVNSQLNTITFALTSNVGISKGGILTISGLTGRDYQQVARLTSSSPCIANPDTDVNTTYLLDPFKFFFRSRSGSNVEMMSTQNSVIVNTKACLQVDSTIKVQVPLFVEPGSVLVLHGRVENWQSKLAGCVPLVSFSGCRTKLDVLGDLTCTGTDSGSACTGCSAQDFTTVARAAADKRVLSSGIPPQIWKKIVKEYTPVLSQPNLISVTLAMNIELTVGTRITIGGFQDSQTLNTLALPVIGDSSSAFGSVGRWYFDDGQLLLTANRLVDINETLVLAFEVVNKGIQDKARCRYGAKYCSGAGGYNEGKSCPKIGAVCSGVCAGGETFCSTNSLRGSCSEFTSDDLKDPVKAEAANAKCEGGVCFPPNNGYQCPFGALVNTTAQSKNAGLLIDPAVDKVMIKYFGNNVFLSGQECRGLDVICSGQTFCVAPNEGSECVKNVQCLGPYDPSIEDTIDNFEKRAGTQRCVRTPDVRDILVFVMADKANITWTKIEGNVVGFSSPTPPEFLVRALSETSSVSGARNILTVSLTANFRLYAVADTNVTLSGLPLHMYGLERRVAILPKNRAAETASGTCAFSDSVVTCENIGVGLVTDDDTILLTAFLNIDLECSKGAPSLCQDRQSLQGDQGCLLIKSVRRGDGNTTLPIGSYSAAPCLDTASSPCKLSGNGKSDCPIVTNLDVIQDLLASKGQGIKVRVHTNAQNANTFSMRAVLKFTRTSEYGLYDRSTQTLTTAGVRAVSMKQDDQTLMFAIPLKNAAIPQAAPSVTVLGESGLVKRIGVCDDEIELGCKRANVPSAVRTSMTGTVLTSSAEGPMRYASIQESSLVRSFTNIMTVELEAETNDGNLVNILAGSFITLSGLRGSQTPSTDNLLISGFRVARYARWDQTQGILIAEVNSMPHSQLPSPLRFSFELKNPSATTAPLLPGVLVGGVSASHGGRNMKLTCQSRANCFGVLAASQAASFMVVELFEKTRYAGHTNTLSFFLTANVPLQRAGTTITVTGVKANSVPAGLALTRNAGTSRRAIRCVGVHGCVLKQDHTVVRGSIATRMHTDMTVACTNENVLSRTFGQQIEELELHAVRVCGQVVSANYINPCSDVVKQWSVFQALPVEPCLGSDYMLIELEGRGLINATSVLNVDYVFDVSSRLVYKDQAFVLTVLTNLSDHAPATQDIQSFAFSFNYTNPPIRQDSFVPTVTSSLEEGTLIGAMAADRDVGASGVSYCNGVLVVAGGKSLPAQNVNLEPGQRLRVYQEITHDGVAECIFIIQPENPNQWLMKLKFDEYDVNEGNEMVEMFNGDSPAAPRMGILYKKTNSFRLDKKYFLSSKEMFVEECAVTLRLLARRLVPAGQQELLGYSKGRAGFAFSYDLIDPSKMDHFKAQLGFSDMVDDVTENSVQLKLRKVFAGTIDILYPSVVFDGASSSRRSVGLVVEVTRGRRAGQGAASIRVLCTSPDETSRQADAFSAVINADLVSSQMNIAGIPGRVVLTAPIQVFRCGIELECVPWEPEIIPVTTPMPQPPVIPPEPFPLLKVASFALGIILGPSIVVLCAVIAYFYFKRKGASELAAKRSLAIEAFKEWISNKEDDFREMSGNELGRLAERFELVEEDQWTDDEMPDRISEMAKYFYRIERGFGCKPEGVYRHVPPKLFAPAKPAVPEKKVKSKGQKGEKVVEKPVEMQKEELLEVTANIKFADDGDDGENGKGCDKKKKGKKRDETKEEKVLWIKRAVVVSEAHEEVAV